MHGAGAKRLWIGGIAMAILLSASFALGSGGDIESRASFLYAANPDKTFADPWAFAAAQKDRLQGPARTSTVVRAELVPYGVIASELKAVSHWISPERQVYYIEAECTDLWVKQLSKTVQEGVLMQLIDAETGQLLMSGVVVKAR